MIQKRNVIKYDFVNLKSSLHMEGATASGWLEVRYIAAGVASRQAQVLHTA
jgi:hypothetical protein